MTETQRMFNHPKDESYLPKSIQNIKTVTTANGIAAICINGIRLPLGFLDLSDKEAISGSVTASKILLKAVIKPITVKKPPIASPGIIYWTAPWSTSALIGKKYVTNQAEMIPPSSDQPNWPTEKISICFF